MLCVACSAIQNPQEFSAALETSLFLDTEVNISGTRNTLSKGVVEVTQHNMKL